VIPMTQRTVKVAVATNNRLTVGQHYGRARSFLVLTVTDGEITERDVRRRPGSLTDAAAGGSGRETGHGRRCAELLADCDALIAGGMGRGAHDNLRRAGVESVLTDERYVEEAALRYAAGDLPSLEDRIHEGPGEHRERSRTTP